MPDWFTDEEMERIVRFAQSSGYDRDPGMLLPDDAEDGDSDPSTTAEPSGLGDPRGGEAVVSEE